MRKQFSKPSTPMPEGANSWDSNHWYCSNGELIWNGKDAWEVCRWGGRNPLDHISTFVDYDIAQPNPHDKAQIGVGVGVMVYRNGKFLVSQRKGSHGAGCWSLPGGHLEFGETIEECARREVLEETGLVLDTVIPCKIATNDIFAEEGKHYVTLWTLARLPDTDIQIALNLEPEKCEGWEWHMWPHIPKPHFLPLANMQERYPLFDTEDGDPCVFV
jgi:8-oxo-dGTP diphosphatase